MHVRIDLTRAESDRESPSDPLPEINSLEFWFSIREDRATKPRGWGESILDPDRKIEKEREKGETGAIRRRTLGFSFRVQLYHAGALNMHDAWALKPSVAFHRAALHPRMQIAAHDQTIL